MDAALRNFIDRWAMMLMSEGLARAAGLVLGYLFVSEQPCSIEEIASELGISKASVSLHGRMFEQAGLVERTPSADRRVYYQIIPDLWRKAMTRSIASSIAIAKLATDTNRNVQGLPPPVRERLHDMADFYNFWAEETPRILERWRATRVADGHREDAPKAIGGIDDDNSGAKDRRGP